MLIEIVKGRQKEAGLSKRWFRNPRMDLFVWTDPGGAVCRFQLAYDTHRQERVLSWSAESGFSHARVHDGATPGRHPQSPIMAAGEDLDAALLYEEFMREAGGLEGPLRDFVAAKIEQAATGQRPATDAGPHAATTTDPGSAFSPSVPVLLVTLMIAGIAVVVALSRSGT